LSLAAFSTGSRQGDARAPGALARLLRSKKLPISFACGEQIHRTRIAMIPQLMKAKKYKSTDGFLTDRTGQPLAIFTADCVPIFVSADHERVVGLLHGGWRGIQKGILAKAVRLLRRKWRISPSQITAWAGPHIGPCCFEVQEDVARHFPRSRHRRKDRWTVDLAAELARQARRLEIRWLRKKGFEGCTMHQSRFYSYRRNQTPQRQVSVIMKREPS
jgi:YfiH family protein